jgi:hypothetical protein
LTDKEIAQLNRELSPEEMSDRIEMICGPAEDWDDADSEFAMRLYGIEPNLSPQGIVDILEGAVRKFRERGEPVPRSLLKVLSKLRKKAKQRS